MTDQELDQVKRITPEVASRYLQGCHSAQDIRLFMREGLCPFGFAVKQKTNWTYRIFPAMLKKYKHGQLPLMRPV